MIKSIDLNCDMGEYKNTPEENFDHLIMPYISSANVACGFHSGDPHTIHKTIKLAIKNQVKIGAHPSYNDRQHFGRKSLKTPIDQLQSELEYQISAIKGMTENLGQKLHHVKPHGALYHDLNQNHELAKMFVDLVKRIDSELTIYAMSLSPLIDLCKKSNLKYKAEAFADRKYQTPTTLVSREIPGSILETEELVLNQIDYIINNKVKSQNNEVIELYAHTICLHSDTSNAVDLAEKISLYLQSKNIKVSA